MKIIYEPKGRAREYAELAVNNYSSCPHGCRYCMAPLVMRKDRNVFHERAIPRTDGIKKWFEHDCQLMQKNHDTRRVHMNFVSDPYPEIESQLQLTRYCLLTAAKYGVGINILTKGCYNIVSRDFQLFKDSGVHLGVTLSFWNDESRREWEPNAATVDDRIRILSDAHKMGIYTWVSMEPVIYPDEALQCIDNLHSVVDLWKVGKLNYHEHAKTVDWPKFREDVVAKLKSYNSNYIIKKDLLEAK